MVDRFVLSLAAVASLVPAAIAAHGGPRARPGAAFWLVLAAAVAGPTCYVTVELSGNWDRSFAVALWLSIACSLALFTLLSLAIRHLWRLTPLLLPYLLLLALLATLFGAAAPRSGLSGVPEAWLVVHIVVSLSTYALATLAAVAGLGVFLQERSLKNKTPSRLTRMLPSIADGERLELGLLSAAEVVLGFGLATGMALEYLEYGVLLRFDHKNVLSIVAFAMMALLLYLNRRHGLRGRRAGRLVLVSYLLLTLAYPGVKFVTDVLIG